MATENSFGDILNSLLENPEVMKAVTSIASNAENAPSDSKTNVESPLPEGFTLPPQLIAKVPQIMSAISGIGGKDDGKSTNSAPNAESSNKTDRGERQRKELLFALKPFLCEKRCAMIDGLLQLESLAGVLSAFTDQPQK